MEALNVDFQTVETLPYDGDLILFPNAFKGVIAPYLWA